MPINQELSTQRWNEFFFFQ